MKNFLRLYYDYGGSGNINYNLPATAAGGGIANNGLSVSGLKIQLGGLAGSAGAAVLLNNREIPMGGFSLLFSGMGVGASSLIFQDGVASPLVPQFIFKNSAGGEQSRLRYDDTGSLYLGVVSGLTATGNGNIGIGNGVFNAAGAQPTNSILIGALAGFTATSGNGLTIIGVDSANGLTTGIGNFITLFGTHNFDGGTGANTLGNNVICVGAFNNNSVAQNVGVECKIFGNSNNILSGATNTTIIGSGFQTAVSNIVLLGNATQDVIIGGALSGQTDLGSTLQVIGSFAPPIRTSAVNATLTNLDFTVIFTAAATATLPTAASSTQRIYAIAAASAGAVTTSINYNNLSNASVNTIAAGTSVMIQSDGTTWRQIK